MYIYIYKGGDPRIQDFHTGGITYPIGGITETPKEVISKEVIHVGYESDIHLYRNPIGLEHLWNPLYKSL